MVARFKNAVRTASAVQDPLAICSTKPVASVSVIKSSSSLNNPDSLGTLVTFSRSHDGNLSAGRSHCVCIDFSRMSLATCAFASHDCEIIFKRESRGFGNYLVTVTRLYSLFYGLLGLLAFTVHGRVVLSIVLLARSQGSAVTWPSDTVTISDKYDTAPDKSMFTPSGAIAISMHKR